MGGFPAQGIMSSPGPKPHVWGRGRSTGRMTYLPLHVVHHVPNPRGGLESAMAEVSSSPPPRHVTTGLASGERRTILQEVLIFLWLLKMPLLLFL
jgi:hypothetical protein